MNSCSLQNKALVVANDVMNAFNKNEPGSVNACRRIMEDAFGEGWQAKGAGVYDEGDSDANTPIWGIGMSMVHLLLEIVSFFFRTVSVELGMNIFVYLLT